MSLYLVEDWDLHRGWNDGRNEQFKMRRAILLFEFLWFWGCKHVTGHLKLGSDSEWMATDSDHKALYPIWSLEHAPAKVGWTAVVGPASWGKWKLIPLIKQGQKLWSYQSMFQISSPWEHFSCFLTSLSEMSHCKFLPLASCLPSGLWLDFWTGFCGIRWPSAYSLDWISLQIPASKLQANSLQQPHNLRSKQPLFELPSLCYSKCLTLISTLASKRRFTTH